MLKKKFIIIIIIYPLLWKTFAYWRTLINTLGLFFCIDIGYLWTILKPQMINNNKKYKKKFQNNWFINVSQPLI
jgi:hypothetical protein